MTKDSGSEETATEEVDTSNAEKALERSAETMEKLINEFMDENRQGWYGENFVHTESGNGDVLSLSPKPDNTIPDIPASGRREETEKYVFQISESPEVVELETICGEKFIGRIKEKSIQWVEIKE